MSAQVGTTFSEMSKSDNISPRRRSRGAERPPFDHAALGAGAFRGVRLRLMHLLGLRIPFLRVLQAGPYRWGPTSCSLDGA